MSTNSYSAPAGNGVAFTPLLAGQTSPNFTLTEQGIYVIVINLGDSNPNDVSNCQVTLQSVSSSGTSTATDTTFDRAGIFLKNVPAGGRTYNFTTVGNVKNISMTLPDNLSRYP
jgi:hypothetical protein